MEVKKTNFEEKIGGRERTFDLFLVEDSLFHLFSLFGLKP
jgi:hypothetical protein